MNGGAIALGHPLGATGARQTVTIMSEAQRREAHYGIVTMCIGGGQGSSGAAGVCAVVGNQLSFFVC